MEVGIFYFLRMLFSPLIEMLYLAVKPFTSSQQYLCELEAQ